ncbi:hypothetical protein TNCV_1457501 [Trichonephila clavipes]|nr:hypothetical protein TNCV_1457501 [Trichonephila clavipes]
MGVETIRARLLRAGARCWKYFSVESYFSLPALSLEGNSPILNLPARASNQPGRCGWLWVRSSFSEGFTRSEPMYLDLSGEKTTLHLTAANVDDALFLKRGCLDHLNNKTF